MRTPRYVEILRTLRQDIRAGVHGVGQNLPSEADLCRIFGTSRFTVREALRRLQDDGLVERTQGAGSRVVSAVPGGQVVQRYRTVGELNRYASHTRIEVMKTGTMRLDALLAEQVGGEAGALWAFFQARRRTRSDGALVCLLESFVPPRLSGHLPDLETTERPIYALLAEAAGEPVIAATQDTQALLMPAHVSDALGLSRGSVALRILRRYVSEKGTLIATFNWHLGGDRFVHRTELSLADPQA